MCLLNLGSAQSVESRACSTERLKRAKNAHDTVSRYFRYFERAPDGYIAVVAVKTKLARRFHLPRARIRAGCADERGEGAEPASPKRNHGDLRGNPGRSQPGGSAAA